MFPNSSETAITKNTAGDCILICPRFTKVYLHAYTEVIYLYKHMFIGQLKLVTGQSKHAWAGLFRTCFRRALAPARAELIPRPGAPREQPRQRGDCGEVELLSYHRHTGNTFNGT